MHSSRDGDLSPIFLRDDSGADEAPTRMPTSRWSPSQRRAVDGTDG